jgi:hypothetical protein
MVERALNAKLAEMRKIQMPGQTTNTTKSGNIKPLTPEELNKISTTFIPFMKRHIDPVEAKITELENKNKEELEKVKTLQKNINEFIRKYKDIKSGLFNKIESEYVEIYGSLSSLEIITNR